MLQRKMTHKDIPGYTEVMAKDGVQIMSAGSVLRHAGYDVVYEEVKFLQIWIERNCKILH
jgi:redox-sensitive bicupin YhaK (pirin superfamily)